MSVFQRFRISFALLGALALAAGIATAIYRRATSHRLYFMPGRLGVVDVPAPRPQITNNPRPKNSAAPRAAGFLTRNIGLRQGEEAEWGRHNAITPGLPFSHHLAAVFPPSLYAAHPDFFPLAYGGRLKPAANAQYWNPDLGRQDVANFAAEQARRYFDANPNAISYSLGINDGLVFGESPETLAFTGVASNDGTTKPLQNQNGHSQEETEATEDSIRTQRTARSSPLSSLPPVQINRPNSDGIPRQDLQEKTEATERVSVSASQHFPALRWFRGRPDFSALVFTFMNRAATELAKTHPDKYLGCLAYYWCENVPPFPVDPHVIPFLTADRSQSYDPAFRREEFELQEKWGKALGIEPTKHTNQTNGFSGAQARTEPFLQEGTERTEGKPQTEGSDQVRSPLALRSPVQTGSAQNFRISDSQSVSISPERLGLYDYLDGQGFLVPRVPIHAFAEHIRHAREMGFTDYYGESSRNWGLDGPLPWTIAQLLSDPDRNVDALLDDYYTLYFQAAAAPMRRFFTRCEEQWMHQPGPSYWLKHYRNESQAVLFPPEVCRELRALLDEAETALSAPSRQNNSPLTPLPPVQISPSDHNPGLQKATKETKGVPSIQTTQSIPRQVLQEATEKTEARTRSTNRTEHLGETARSASPLSQLSPVQIDRASSDGIRREILHEKTQATEARTGSEKPAAQKGRAARSDSPLTSAPSVQTTASIPRQVLQEETEATEVRAAGTTRKRQTGESSSPLPPLSPVQTRMLLDRVRFVSDSFGVTERFVAFQNARDALARAALTNELSGTEQRKLLVKYLDARGDFVRYAREIAAKWPLAFYPINYDDWLRNDPAFAAGWRISEGGAATRFTADGRKENRESIGRARLAEVAARALAARRARDVLPNGAMAGVVQRGRRIGGLPYGIDLPAPWLSLVEPTEHGVAMLEAVTRRQADTWKLSRDSSPGIPEKASPTRSDISAAMADSFQDVSGSASQRFALFRGQENATLYQWIPVKPGRLYAASTDARGAITNSDAVMLTFGWLDAEHRPIGNPIVMRLPDGEWPEWVTLRQGDRAPANAAWLGIGLRIMHQIAPDWAEFRRFSVLEIEE